MNTVERGGFLGFDFFRVREFLSTEGIVLGSIRGEVLPRGNEISFPDLMYFSLLVPVPGRDLLVFKKRARLICEVHFEPFSDAPEEVKDKDWEVKIYGRENVERITELAKKMGERFGKTVGIWVANDGEKKEARPFEFVPGDEKDF